MAINHMTDSEIDTLTDELIAWQKLGQYLFAELGEISVLCPSLELKLHLNRLLLLLHRQLAGTRITEQGEL